MQFLLIPNACLFSGFSFAVWLGFLFMTETFLKICIIFCFQIILDNGILKYNYSFYIYVWGFLQSH